MRKSEARARGALISLSLLFSVSWAWAGGTVSQPTETALQAALAGGGAVTFACNGTITLSQTLNIMQDTTIDAGGYQVTVSGGSTVRLFTVTNAALRVSGLTLANGRVLGANGTNGTSLCCEPAGRGQDAAGACILSFGGSVALTGCTLTNHSVQGGDGGMIGGYISAQGGRGSGGAIWAVGGRVDLTNCLVVSCAATGGLGITGDFVNGSGAGLGGALYVQGASLNLKGVTLVNLQATGGGGLQYPASLGAMWGAAGCGGGIYATNSSLVAESSVLAGNVAISGPHDVNSQGTGSMDGSGGAVFLTANSSAWFNQCTFATNTASSADPGYHGTAGSGCGGAIYNGGTLQAYNCNYSGNTAQAALGIYSSPVGRGGALYSTNFAVLVGCTLQANLAHGAPGSGPMPNSTPQPGEGGGAWNSGRFWATNCTWASNRALSGTFAGYPNPLPASGGGLCVTGGVAVLVNQSFVGNQATTGVAGDPSKGSALMNTNGQVLVLNSIFAYTPAGSGSSNLWGVLNDGGYNLSSDATGGFTAPSSHPNTDPLLGPLANYGGPTATCWPQLGSPARDQVPAGFPATDQRGAPRPQGPAADIGAVEADQALVAPFPLLAGSSGANLTVSLTGDSWRVYRLLRSTDLVTWTAVATNSPASDGSLQFTVPATAPKACYRVATP